MPKVDKIEIFVRAAEISLSGNRALEAKVNSVIIRALTEEKKQNTNSDVLNLTTDDKKLLMR